MGQYLNSAMSGFSSEFPESEDPSGVESNSEEFWSPNFNRQRGQDELRVNREYMNTKRSLLRYGHEDEVREAEKDLSQKSFLERLMDGLSASNYALAGGVREFQKGGSNWDAMKRAGAELAASSDIFDRWSDEEIADAFGSEVNRESFADVLREGKAGDDFSSAALGLVMDIALDPLTYASFGVVPILRTPNYLQKSAKAISPFINVYSAAYAGGKFAARTKLGGALPRSLTEMAYDPEHVLGRITRVVGDAFNNRYGLTFAVKGANQEQLKALSGFADHLGVHDADAILGSRELQEKLKGMVGANPEAFAGESKGLLEKAGLAEQWTDRLDQGVNIRDLTLGLSAGMTGEERNLAGLFMSADAMNVLKKYIKAEIPDRADFLIPKLDAYKEMMDIFSKERNSMGLLSSHEMRLYWNAPQTMFRNMTTGGLDDLAEKFMGRSAKTNLEEMLTKIPGGIESLPQSSLDNLVDTFSSLENRVWESVGDVGKIRDTNLDITSMGINQSYRTLRETATRRLNHGTLSDPEIAKRIVVRDDYSGLSPDMIRENEILRHIANESKLPEIKDSFRLFRPKGESARQFEDAYSEFSKEILSRRQFMRENQLVVYKPEEGFDLGVTKVKDLKKGQRYRDPETQEILTVGDKIGDASKSGNVRQSDSGRFSRLDPDTMVWAVKNADARKGVDLLSTQASDQVPLHSLKRGDTYAYRGRNGALVEGKVNYAGKSDKISVTGGKSGAGQVDSELSVMQVDTGVQFMMHEEIGKALKKINTAFSGRETEITTTGTLGKMMKFQDKYMALWKGYAVTSPGFLSRQVQSGAWSNWLAGVPLNPKLYIDAMRLQAGKAQDLKVVATMKDGTKKTFQGNEIIAEADRLGVRGTSGYTRDLGLTHPDEDILNHQAIRAGAKGEPTLKALGDYDNPVIDMVTRQDDVSGDWFRRHVSGNFGSGGRLLELNRTMGGAIENNGKLAHFLYKVRTGSTLEDAAGSAKKYLFDYGDLSDFERNVMRRIIPFYTWARKNVPLMWGELMTNPGRFGITPKVFAGIEDLTDDQVPMHTPDYFQEVTALRMPKVVDRTVRDANAWFAGALYNMGILKDKPEEVTGLQPIFLKPDLPFQDLDMFEDFGEVISSFSPLIKALPEYALGGTGKGFSFFLDRPIERFEGEPANLAPVPIEEATGIMKKLGILGDDGKPQTNRSLEGNTQNAIQSLLPPIYGKFQRLRGKAQKGQLVSQLASEFAGVRFIQNDIANARYSKGIKRRNKMRDLKKKLQKTGLYPQYVPRRTTGRSGPSPMDALLGQTEENF